MSLKNIKAGDSVIVKGFTGIKLGVFTVSEATAKTITIEKKQGGILVFSKKDGKQVNVEEGKERFANSVMENDGSYVRPKTGRKKKSVKESTKPAKQEKPKAEPELEDFDDFDDDDFEEFE